ncbi:MAG: hypothetical protein JWR32_2755 [Mycobacterium sp.]|jgi:DUF4097 and DUF4098 domain-containing protein YvlB|nr:hypothetical protein [Mycobacterium sp.]
MPTFATPDPITACIEASAGSIRITASDRSDTVVDVRPRDESRPADVRSAEGARVEYANGKLAVSPAKFGFLGYRMGAVEIVIELPSRSRVQVAVASADAQADGEFADFRFDSASGRLDVQSISGTAKIATASGDAAIADVNGNMKFQAASGSLSLDRMRGHVKSQTASGSVSVGAAVRGGVVAHTSSGDVEVGIPEGTAAELDIMTGSGSVTNRLQPSAGPEQGDDTVVVEVLSGSGDVDIHRALNAPAR